MRDNAFIRRRVVKGNRGSVTLLGPVSEERATGGRQLPAAAGLPRDKLRDSTGRKKSVIASFLSWKCIRNHRSSLYESSSDSSGGSLLRI